MPSRSVEGGHRRCGDMGYRAVASAEGGQMLKHREGRVRSSRGRGVEGEEVGEKAESGGWDSRVEPRCLAVHQAEGDQHPGRPVPRPLHHPKPSAAAQNSPPAAQLLRLWLSPELHPVKLRCCELDFVPSIELAREVSTQLRENETTELKREEWYESILESSCVV